MTPEGDPSREGLPVNVTRIQLELRGVGDTDDLEVRASYELEVAVPSKRIVVHDRGIINVNDVSLATGAQAQKAWTHATDGSMVDATILTAPHGTFFGSLQLNVAAQWRSAMRERRNGSPILSLADDLPWVVNGYNHFDAAMMPVDAPRRSLPKLSVQLSWDAPSSEVRNVDGSPTMQSVLTRRSGAIVWHADEKLILVGDALAGESRALRLALRDLLLELHAFVGNLYGNSDRVRVLGIAEAGAYAYRGRTGQYCAIDKWMIGRTASGWFPAARLLLRDIAAMWWCYGLQPVGAFGMDVAYGLAIATSMHWLRISRRKDDLQTEIGGAELLMAKGHGAGSVALAVDKAATADDSIYTRLRKFCVENWGMAVPYSHIVGLLSDVGVQLPRALLNDN
jgi:hypothetical protein